MNERGRKSFLENIYRLWEYKGKPSQTDFAKQLGVSQRTVCNLLTAKDNPAKNFRMDVVDTIADKLKVESWVLLVPDLDPAKMRFVSKQLASDQINEEPEAYDVYNETETGLWRIIEHYKALPIDRRERLVNMAREEVANYAMETQKKRRVAQEKKTG